MTVPEIIVAVISIIIIDIVLGGDNAIIIALASRTLPPEKRKKAIIYGTIGAVAVRIALTGFALYLLKIPLLQFAGGILLVWIAFKLLLEEKNVECKEGKNLLDAIKIIIVADVVIGIDNVIAIAGAAHGSFMLVVLGLIVSVPIIVWGSTFILKWLERFPVIVYIGAGVLAWTAGKMIAADVIVYREIGQYIPYFDLVVPAIIFLVVTGTGYYVNKYVRCKVENKGDIQ
ncbi:MAG: membrane protein [Peptococcaceae bacterium BICA1-7]|nr:MAG: membrane protein [Peptococcaceae bacterium BICA1-7]HBV95978.1 TerC family protein [Desulfotomaculum sp.]